MGMVWRLEGSEEDVVIIQDGEIIPINSVSWSGMNKGQS